MMKIDQHFKLAKLQYVKIQNILRVNVFRRTLVSYLINNNFHFSSQYAKHIWQEKR